MAGLGSVLDYLPVIADGVSLVNSTLQSEASTRRNQKSQDLALKQLQQQQNTEFQIAQENAALERQQIAINAEIAEENRRRALKRAVARQRASFGGQGVGSGAGSSQAVLLGLISESDEEREQRERLDTLRDTAINQDLSQTVRLNTLQREQLKERNNLNNLSNTVDRFGNITNFGVGALEINDEYQRIRDQNKN
ncbi:MAG: transporter [Pseudomonadota bacterium]